MTRTIWDLERQPRVPRKPIRFSLRWLMAILAICAVGLAIMAKPMATYRRESLAARHFTEQGATITWCNRFPSPFYLHRSLCQLGLKTPYQRVQEIRFHRRGRGPTPKPVSLDGIDQFRHLRKLDLDNCQLTDTELSKVESAGRYLSYLDVQRNPQITDESFSKLTGRNIDFELMHVELVGTKITNATLREFLAGPGKGLQKASIDIAVRSRVQREFGHRVAQRIGRDHLQTIYDSNRRLLPSGTVSVSFDFTRPLDLGFIDFVVNEPEVEHVRLSVHHSQLSKRALADIGRLGDKLQRLYVRVEGLSLQSVLDTIQPLSKLETLEVSGATDAKFSSESTLALVELIVNDEPVPLRSQ